MNVTIETPNLIGIFITSYLVSTLAGIAGIGGGAMLISLYSLIGNISIKYSIILSVITITGNSFIRTIYYSFKKNEKTKNRYLPNYEIVRLIVPFDGNLSYIGYILNKILPNFVIFILIIILMLILCYKTIIKTIQFVRKKSTKDDIFIIFDNIETKLSDNITINYNRKGQTKKDIIDNYIYIILSFSLIIIFTIARNLIKPYWLVYIIQFFIIILFGYFTIKHIQLQYKWRKKILFNFIEGDIEWNNYINFIKYCTTASFVGLISTMVGIGGGMIMNPLLINYGILPDIVIATSSITTFFSSIASALQFIIEDNIFEWYFIALFGIGGFSSITGIIILKFLKKKIKIIITIILAITLVLSLILLIIFNVLTFINDGIN